jgi:hypothetical protein
VADSLITYVNEIVAQYVLVIKDIKARAEFCLAVKDMFHVCTKLVARTLAGRNYEELEKKLDIITDALLPASGTIADDQRCSPDSAFLDSTQENHLEDHPDDLQYSVQLRQDDEAALLRHMFPKAVLAERDVMIAIRAFDSFLHDHPQYETPTKFPLYAELTRLASALIMTVEETVDRLRAERESVSGRILHDNSHQRATSKLQQIICTRVMHVAKPRRDVASNRVEAWDAFLQDTDTTDPSREIDKQLGSIKEPNLADFEAHAQALSRMAVPFPGLAIALARLLAAKSDLRRETSDFRGHLGEPNEYRQQRITSVIRHCHDTYAEYLVEKAKAKLVLLNEADGHFRDYYFGYCDIENETVNAIITVLHTVTGYRENSETSGVPVEKTTFQCLSQRTDPIAETICTLFPTAVNAEKRFALAPEAYGTHARAHCSSPASPDIKKLDVALAEAGKGLLAQQLSIIKDAPTAESPAYTEVLRTVSDHLKSNREKLHDLGALDGVQVTPANDDANVFKHPTRRGKPYNRRAVVESIRQKQSELNGDSALQQLYLEDVATVTASLNSASPDLCTAYEELAAAMRPLLIIKREIDRAIALATGMDQQKSASESAHLAKALQVSKERLAEPLAAAQKCRDAVEMWVIIAKAYAEGELDAEIGEEIAKMMDELVLETPLLTDLKGLEEDMRAAGVLPTV